MNRLIIAIMLLITSAGVCITEQICERNTYQAINEYVANEDIEGLQKYWDERNDILFMLTDHRTLDEMSRVIHEASSEDKEIALTKVKAINTVYYENQKITLANIL